MLFWLESYCEQWLEKEMEEDVCNNAWVHCNNFDFLEPSPLQEEIS